MQNYDVQIGKIKTENMEFEKGYLNIDSKYMKNVPCYQESASNFTSREKSPNTCKSYYLLINLKCLKQ